MTFPIVLLSGPPGSGKSTVARRLVDGALAARTVHLAGDVFWGFIRKSFIQPHLPESHEQNAVVMEAVLAAALPFQRAGYEVIVDWVIGPWWLDKVREMTAGVDVAYVILRPPVEDCAQRAAKRADAPILDYGPLRGLYESFCDLGPLEAHVLEDTGGAEELALSIRAGLARGAFRLT